MYCKPDQISLNKIKCCYQNKLQEFAGGASRAPNATSIIFVCILLDQTRVQFQRKKINGYFTCMPPVNKISIGDNATPYLQDNKLFIQSLDDFFIHIIVSLLFSARLANCR